jgi:hypothetical protein
MEVRLSASRTDRAILLRNIFISVSGTHFCWTLSKTRGRVRLEGLCKLIKIIHLAGSRTRDIPEGIRRTGYYECCHLPRYSAKWSVCEPTFRKNVSPLHSGLKISQTRNQRIAGAVGRWRCGVSKRSGTSNAENVLLCAHSFVTRETS